MILSCLCENSKMNIGKCEFGQVERKIDCTYFNEIFRIEAVKSEPSENFDISNSETYFEEDKHATDSSDSYHEGGQNAEKLGTNLKPKDLGHSKFFDKLSTSTSDSVGIKNEDIDIFYEDIKLETSEEKPSIRFCVVCYQNFDLDVKTDFKSAISRSKCRCRKPNESRFYNSHGKEICGQDLNIDNDVKPFSLDLTSDSRLQPLEVTAGEVAKEEVSPALPQRLSMDNDNRMKLNFCSEPLENNLSTLEKRDQCKICSKYFCQMDHFNVHENVHTGEKTFHCKICSKSFSRKDTLRLHEKSHTGEKPFRCKVCSKSFIQMRNLKVHERVHTGEKPFRCKICSKYFSQKGNLTVHEQGHTDENLFHCGICSKSFNKKYDLENHKRVHTGEKPFRCKMCSKSFSQKGNLTVHEKRHAGDKPFSCQICSKAFNCQSDLMNHKKIHTGEKPFCCKICSKSFTYKSNLKVHEKSHSGEKPFRCENCPKSFSRKDHLTVHVRTHTGEKPFHCKICSKTFIDLSGLSVHRRSHP